MGNDFARLHIDKNMIAMYIKTHFRKFFCIKSQINRKITMIISFSVENYKSIRNKAILNFEANLKDQTFQNNFRFFNSDNSQDTIGCLTTLGIWGANASGKSNLIQAIKDFYSLIVNSSHYSLNDPIPEYKPFRLAAETQNAPSCFELDFCLQNIRYFYRVEFLQDRIVNEELYRYSIRGRTYLFKRNNPTNENIMLKRNQQLLKGKIAVISCLKNQLFLSCAANSSAGITSLVSIYQYLSNHDFADSTKLKQNIIKYYDDSFYFRQLEAFIVSIDVGISKVEMQEDKYSTNDKIPVFYHGESNEAFKLADESLGTQSVFKIIPFYLYILENGYSYFCDEIEAHLHPAVVALLIRMFHDPEINRHGAQLLFTSHALSLLDNEFMRRDQICFTQKDYTGSTELYALDEFKIRKETDFYRWYQDGRFDALPDLQYDELKQKIITAFAKTEKETK